MTKKAIVIGAGISGATLARILAECGWRVDVFEKRSHVGGNCHDETAANGILFHRYGPHIFHTTEAKIAAFVQRFAKFNGYINRVGVRLPRGIKSRLPFNFPQIRAFDPNNGGAIIEFLRRKFPCAKKVSILELQKVRREFPPVGRLADWLYENIYAPYTAKMWGVPIDQVDPNVISRVGVTLSDDESYFPGALLQGLPVGGYTAMIKRILDHPNIDLRLKTDGLKKLSLSGEGTIWENQKIVLPIVYCGQIEALLNGKYGRLPYRSLEFRFTSHPDAGNRQDLPIINRPKDKKRTRTVEYKQMTLQKHSGTIISTEYPGAYEPDGKRWRTPYYPINNDANQKLYSRYAQELSKYRNLYCLGRLAEYRYLDMDAAILSAMHLAEKITKSNTASE